MMKTLIPIAIIAAGILIVMNQKKIKELTNRLNTLEKDVGLL